MRPMSTPRRTPHRVEIGRVLTTQLPPTNTPSERNTPASLRLTLELDGHLTVGDLYALVDIARRAGIPASHKLAERWNEQYSHILNSFEIVIPDDREG